MTAMLTLKWLQGSVVGVPPPPKSSIKPLVCNFFPDEETYLCLLPLLFIAAVHCGQYHFPFGASVSPTHP